MDQAVAEQITSLSNNLAFFTMFSGVFIPIVIFIVGLIFYWSHQELKTKVAELESKNSSLLVLDTIKANHLTGKVDEVRRQANDLEKRYEYLFGVVNRVAASESEMTQKIEAINHSQLDTSLVALLSDGIVKELTKEDVPPNQPTV